MEHWIFNWTEHNKADLVERLYRGGSYEEFLEANINVIYSYNDEYGPYGSCVMIDKNENVYNCEFSKGVMNGYMIIAKFDELIGVYYMENGRIISETDVSLLKHNQLIDLTNEEEYCWEGDILNDIPYGWGEVFDISNRLVYVGFRLYNEKVCFGRSYYPLTGILEYEGNYCKGKRWGFGRLYDESGILEYEGLWLNNEKMNQYCCLSCKECVQLSGIHSLINEVIIGENCCRTSAMFSFHHYSNLQTLRIGDQSFVSVRRVRIQSNPKLEQLSLGSHVFEHAEDLILDGRCDLSNPV